MSSRISALGLAVLVAATASSAVSPPGGLRSLSAPGSARLVVAGSRSTAQRHDLVAGKMDSTLADLARHAASVRPGHEIEDLHALSPAARFHQASTGTPLVLVDSSTRGEPGQLLAALQSLGLQRPAVYANDVGGWLPVGQIGAAAARAEVLSLRAALPRRRAGAVTSQGDFAQRSDVVRANAPGLQGTGVTVGVLSDSFNCYAAYAAPGSGVPVSGNQGYASNGFTADFATDVSTGDLPASVNVVEEAGCLNYGAPTQLPFTDEGRAMLQIVHDVAPGAALAFYTAENSEADFAHGITALAAAGARVIADDVGYFDEPFYQDGIVAQAINTVQGRGVAYFSAAGNDGNLSYESTAPAFSTLAGSGAMAGEYLLNFDPTGATTATALPVTIPPIPPGDFVGIVVQWDQPFVTGTSPASAGASSSIDVCVTGATNSVTITDYDGNPVSCTGPNAVGVDPVQILIIGNPANAAGNSSRQTVNIMVGLAVNSLGRALPGRLIVAVEDDGLGSGINAFATHSATLQGHPGAAGANAVGAAFYFQTPRCGSTPAQLEPYSSVGGAPILFDTSGNRLAAPIVRQKPDVVGPDAVNDTFLGITLAANGTTGANGLLATTINACQNIPSYPNFFGTSAATPHVAAIAALMLQANPAVTPAQITSALHNSALPMGSTAPNFSSGYGFIQADAALVVPTLTLAGTAITLGGSTTLSWSSINAASCTASGAWTGAQPTSGSLTLTPVAAGVAAYTLTCVDGFGTSAASTANLTISDGSTVPAAPALSLTPASVAVGGSTTLSWSSANASACLASGAWSGAQAANGSVSITPAAVGTETFTLSCSNSGGASAPSSVVLTVTPELVAPAAPALALAATTIAAGTATHITWSSTNATACTGTGSTNTTALGSWNGALPTSGSYTELPTTIGTYVFNLTCSNAGGTSPVSTVTLNVTATPSTGGLGGLDALTLLGLAALVIGGSAGRFSTPAPRPRRAGRKPHPPRRCESPR